MNQQLNLSIKIFDFQFPENSIGKSFKLRFSILKSSIAEAKMVKGSHPLVGYTPDQSFCSEPFQVKPGGSVNQSCDIPFTRQFTLHSQETFLKSEHPWVGETDVYPILVLELLVKDRTSDFYLKNFETDSNGFANIGHNRLRLKLSGQEVHQALQVLFSEVVFCSVGLVFHIQTVKLTFLSGDKSKTLGTLYIFYPPSTKKK